MRSTPAASFRSLSGQQSPGDEGREALSAPSSSGLPSLQMRLSLDWATTSFRLRISTSLLINYPSAAFMSLPLTLSVTGFVMRAGVIEQVGTPLELYDRPANQFVAQFIGTPQMNVVPAQLLPARPGWDLPAGGSVGLRPEHLSLCAPGQGQLCGRVELLEALGAETLIYVGTPEGAQLVARQNSRSALKAGDDVGLQIDFDAAHLFDAQGRITRTGQAREALSH